MADEDRQPPQSYDTVAPAGVGASSSNQVSPGTIQEILDTGDSTLIDQAFDQMTVEDMIAYVEQLPSPSAFRTSSPAGVGSQPSRSPSFHSPQTTPASSPDTPLSWGSATLTPTPRTARGGRTAAGAGGDGNGRGGRGGSGGRGNGRGGSGRGGSGGRGGTGGAGAGGAGVVVVVVVVVLLVVLVVEEEVVEEVEVVGVEEVVVVVAVVVAVVVDDADDDDDFSPVHL